MFSTLTARKTEPFDGSLTIRFATPDDEVALSRLAESDSSRAPRGAVLVAEVGDELWAALSLEDGHAIADPFRPSGELSFLLAERARQIARTMRREPLHGRRLTPSAA